VTVAVAFRFPAPIAVSVNWVVDVTDTGGALPESGSGPDSLPANGSGEMLTDNAFVVVHDNVLSPPEFTVAGVAVKLPIVGATGCATFTVTDWLVDPPGPMAVKL
jgi:hypothetical protein